MLVKKLEPASSGLQFDMMRKRLWKGRIRGMDCENLKHMINCKGKCYFSKVDKSSFIVITESFFPAIRNKFYPTLIMPYHSPNTEQKDV